MLTLQLARDLSRDPELIESDFHCVFWQNDGWSDSSVYIHSTDTLSIFKKYHGLGVWIIQEYHKLHTKYSDRAKNEDMIHLSRKMSTPYGTISRLGVDILSLSDSAIRRHRVGDIDATFTSMDRVDWPHLTELRKHTKRNILENLYMIQDLVMQRLVDIWVPIEGNIWNGLWKKNALSGNNIKFHVNDGVWICTVTDVWSSIRWAVYLERKSK